LEDALIVDDIAAAFLSFACQKRVGPCSPAEGGKLCPCLLGHGTQLCLNEQEAGADIFDRQYVYRGM
jgi:hypothetical protein